MTDEHFKYEWDDECNCDCSIITYDSLISRLEEQLEYNNGFAKQDAQNALDFIIWQKEEHDKLLQKLQQAKSEALMHAFSKFAAHSDYHGGMILCQLKCMAEGKETIPAKPIDIKELKSEAIKEFAERLKNTNNTMDKRIISVERIDNLVKEMTKE